MAAIEANDVPVIYEGMSEDQRLMAALLPDSQHAPSAHVWVGKPRQRSATGGDLGQQVYGVRVIGRTATQRVVYERVVSGHSHYDPARRNRLGRQGAYVDDAPTPDEINQAVTSAQAAVARASRPGRPKLRDEPLERVEVKIPAALVAAIDAATSNRTAFIERAIRAALAQPSAE